MREDWRIFFQDVIDHADCPDCGAEKGVACEVAMPDGVPPEFGAHEARVKARRDEMTDEDYARFGLQVLASWNPN